jgi:outer membrane biosynthesis protein TonB
MTAGERNDSKRRWLIAGAASLLLHASLLLWWRGVDLMPGGGDAGALGGGFAPGSVVEVQIDVDAPVAAGTTLPAEDVTTERASPAVEPTSAEAAGVSESTSGTHAPQGTSGDGTGGDVGGSGAGAGTGGGLEGLGTGARTGGAGSGTAPSAVVPPRPVEITWPDTRRLSHCVGLRVDVRIRVDARGRVETVEPVSTGVPDDCMRAALDTARRIRFTAGTVGGEPATLWSLVTIDFEKSR